MAPARGMAGPSNRSGDGGRAGGGSRQFEWLWGGLGGVGKAGWSTVADVRLKRDAVNNKIDLL